jgi:hypothetical protein
MRGIEIEYVTQAGRPKTALLPSFTTFGRKKTADMISRLEKVNPRIRIDPAITKLLQM